MNKIITGDALQVLKTLESESVDCAITSPPYYALRDYGVPGQIGLEKTVEDYIWRLIEVFDEVNRVLKKTGTLWVNLGDTYYGGGRNKGGTKPHPKGVRGLRNLGDSVPGPKGQVKSLAQIPSRFALAMTSRGWILRNELIWKKTNAMPQSVSDRFTVDFEKLYFFTKSTRYFFKQQFEERRTHENRPDAVVRDRIYNYDSKQSKLGKWRHVGFHERWDKSPTEKRNKRAVWSIPTQPYTGAHFATFPEKLVEPIMLAGCPKGGVVLDPFSGAGTTGVVAKKLGRNYIGIELNKDYVAMSEERIANTPTPLL